jgi:predicted enzyme related to lactoylglutathione lyase
VSLTRIDNARSFFRRLSNRPEVARHLDAPDSPGGEVPMAVPQGRFSWFELATTDVDDARAFWSEVSGLGQSTMEMGDRKYHMLVQGDRPVAGVVEPQMPNVPPSWLSYWEFHEIDERVQAVQKHGGTVHVPPTDIPTVGRFAVVADPQGATFALFKSAPEGADPGDAFHWNELWAKDATAVVPFYTKALGLEQQQMPNANGPGPYYIFKFDGTQVGGALTSPPKDKVPPMWLPYLRVDDADAAVARAKAMGGRVIADVMNVEGIGRFGIVADRQGAVLGLIKPAPRP